MTDPEKAVDAAIRYADRGWPVFPVAPSPQKRPMNDEGFLAATTDHATIIAWWSRWPTAQVGIACGAAGIVVIDVDVKPDRGIDGRVALDELRMEHGVLDSELVMLTPSGGTQTFFADRAKACRRRLGVRNGIDLLGDGGYTIAPSPASPGREWLSGDPLEELAPAPSWLVDLAGSGALPQRTAGKRSASSAVPDEQGPPLSPAQVADIRAALAYIDNWGRDVWLRVGFALRSTAAGEQAYQLWTEWSKRTPDGSVHPKFNEHDQRKTWLHARPTFADGSEVTLSSLFHMAQKEGYAGPTADMPQTEITLQIKPRAAQQALELVPAGEDAAVEPEPAEPAPPVVLREGADLTSDLPKANGINIATWDEVLKRPAVEWQVDGMIPLQSLFMLGGDTEAGKSFLMIDLALHIVHGMHWCGRKVVAGNVLYLAGEGHSGIAGRLRAWRENVRPENAVERGYFAISDRIPELSAKTIKTLHELVRTVAKATGAPPDLIVIDTLSQAMVADENDAAEVSAVLRGIDLLRKRWGCSIGFAHHTVKLNAKLKRGEKAAKPTRDSMRGSSVITRNVDTVLGLIVGDGGVTRELHTWKQKDGAKPDPIHLQMLVVETGAVRLDGTPETSCVMVPDAIAGESLDKAPEEPDQSDEAAFQKARVAKNAAQVALAEEAVLAFLKKSGAVRGTGNRGGMSMGSLKTQVEGRDSIIVAAVGNLLLKGAVVDVGGSRGKSILAVPETSGTTDPCPTTRA